MNDESAPCQLGAADPAYSGYLTDSELVDALNELLEAERAGAAAVGILVNDLGAADAELRERVLPIGRDEGHFCRMLITQVRRLDGKPSEITGAFVEKISALDTFDDRMALLIRGQSWVVKRLDKTLPRVRDDILHTELLNMRDVHIENVDACDRLLSDFRRNRACVER